MIIEDFNEVEFSQEEINKYKNTGNITEEKMLSLTNKVKDTFSKRNMEHITDDVKNLLENDENIEEIIKGMDMDDIAFVTAFGKYAISAASEFTINKIVFITNRRIFIVDTNFYNKQFEFKEYKKSDIESIETNKKSSKMSLMDKLNLVMAYMAGFFVSIILIPFGIVIKTLFYILYMIITYKLIRKMSISSNNIAIEFKDGYVFEIISKDKFPEDLQKHTL